MQLTVDRRAGVHNQNIEIANVDASTAFLWIEKLDGKLHTLINLKRLDGSNFIIGGGPSWYVVVFDGEGKNLTLQNPDGLEEEMIELCVGGQYGEYSKTICVDQNQAIQAVTLFFEKKELHAAWG